MIKGREEKLPRCERIGDAIVEGEAYEAGELNMGSIKVCPTAY